MRELIIDNFAGGGGASQGIYQALGIHVDIAINHDEYAIQMHKLNHPETIHLCENIWEVDPVKATKGRPVGFAWFSPDCTHFSRAKGGKPVKKNIRGLAWVVLKWAKSPVRPRVFCLENVTEFQTWGPLDKNNKPDKNLSGKTFKKWKTQLEKLGYVIEYRTLVAADYGAPTIRKRLYLIARCDGQPIIWPKPTHGPGLLPYKTAAECIDWSLPCPSIFERKRELAENTLRRIARGIKRYVIEAKEPFIFKIGQTGGNSYRSISLREPLRTIVSKAEDCLVIPHLTKYHGLQGGETRAQALNEPVRTIDTSNRFVLVSAFLSKYYNCDKPASSLFEPTPTVTAIDHNALVAAHLTKFYGTNTGSDMREPVPTITASGQHIAEVRAFLTKYHGTGDGQDLREPARTLTAKHRFGLVVVLGIEYQICDIGLRMLQPRELARAQGFPDSYILTGPKSQQVAKIGNSVCPCMAEVLVRANYKIRENESVKSA